VVVRRGRRETLCARGADSAPPRGPSTSPLEGKPLPQLIYETTDTDFADRAIEALRNAGIPGIPSYRVGRGYSSGSSYPGKGFTEDEVCLYIENELDYRPANDILIKLGAVVEEPPKLPSRKVLFVIVFIVVAVAFWVASQS